MRMLRRFKIKSLMRKVAKLSKLREQETVPDSQVAKEVQAYHRLSQLYRNQTGDKKTPFAKSLAQEALRAAANLQDREAQYQLAKLFFDAGCFWTDTLAGPLKASVQTTYQTQAFNEAHAFANAAIEQGHIFAKRLLGLAYINGWGVEIDQDKGFQLVVDSIDEENAWDRVTKIFDEIGLNKPEFFAHMMQLRQQKRIGK